jgi:hypothetical protein
MIILPHTDPIRLDLADAQTQSDSAPDCAYCGQAIASQPFVQWQFTDARLALHGDCATAFAVNVLGDVRECRLAAGGRHWRQRAARIAGYALCQAEGRPEVQSW